MVEDPSDNESDNDGEFFQLEQGNDDQNEVSNETNSEQFDPNESDNTETQTEFDPNAPDTDVIPEEFDPNSDNESDIPEFDPNAPVQNKEQDEFDPNDPDEEERYPELFDPNEEEENYEPNERGDYEQEGYSGEFENEYAQTMSTILITENEMYAYLKQYVEAMLEKEKELAKQGEQIEKSNLENEPSELEQFLEQEKERIRLEQQQAELVKASDNESESESITNEEDRGELIEPEPESATKEENVEQEQEQVDSPDEIAPNTEEEVRLEEDKEKLGLENEDELSPHNEEEDLRLEEELEELIAPELEHIKEEELDNQEILHEELQTIYKVEELDLEENAEEQEFKTSQDLKVDESELEIARQGEEKEKEEELERREIEEPQQKLEEILEQTRKVEKEYEEAKKLYRQETGKSPIYANKETKGFKQWQEQRREAEREENEWLEHLTNWAKEKAGEEITQQTKEELIEISEKYNELDELTTKFQELYQKEQSELISQSEKVELKALIKTLQKHEPSHVVLFTNLRAMKRYATRQKLKKRQLNRIFTHVFTKFSPNKQINRILKASRRQKTPEEEIFEKFMKLTHKNEFVKNIVNEFNKSGNWIKNLRPTQTFINFLKKKVELLKNERQAEILSKYLSLIIEIKENDSLTKAIKNLFLRNKGKFNSYDIQNWLLISDVAALNQLKKNFTEEEYQEYVRTQKHVSIKTIEEIAKRKGGKCHSKTIKNAKSRLHLECAEKHHFYPTYDSVVYQRTWCPHCHIYVGEEICRQFFERIFRRSFPKSHPPWLNGLELDGDCEELLTSWEYQGKHHYEKAFGLTDEDVKKIQERDADKANKCKEHGRIHLQIPYVKILPYDKMQNFIIKTYEKMSGKFLGNIPKYDWREFTIHENKHAKKFRKYVEEKGGTLLTPYFTAKKEVTIMCEHGHEWTTTPDSVYRGNWCSVCARNIKGTTEEYRKIGEKFQCELMNTYVNAKTPLRYMCSQGHTFTRTPYWLKRKYKEYKNICPKCERAKYAQKFQKFVQNNGGWLLSSYKGRFKPVKIKCENEHEWETTPGSILQGHWCKICAGENDPNKKRKEATKQEFLKIIKSLNYTLLSNYENNTKLVQIKCNNNHTFPITPKYFKRLVTQKIAPCKKCRKKMLIKLEKEGLNNI